MKTKNMKFGEKIGKLSKHWVRGEIYNLMSSLWRKTINYSEFWGEVRWHIKFEVKIILYQVRDGKLMEYWIRGEHLTSEIYGVSYKISILKWKTMIYRFYCGRYKISSLRWQNIILFRVWGETDEI